MQRSNINPEIYQEMLDSASNAAAKGQSQFYTPRNLAVQLARLLPAARNALTDLNCGAGDLLIGAANESTKHLYGVDIDPSPKTPRRGEPATVSNITNHRVCADVTMFYPVLQQIDWQTDLFVLNPPWDLHFYRDRLAALSESDKPAVRAAFAAHDGRTTPETIDSTVATFLIALDRMTERGEGFLIGNNATIERLITGTGAPHHALREHIWAHLVIPGNPMTGLTRCSFEESMETGVLYFAASHDSGPSSSSTVRVSILPGENALDGITRSIDELVKNRHRHRVSELRSWNHALTDELWIGAIIEWKARAKSVRPDFNLWLTQEGIIKVHLSIFDRNARKKQAGQLHALDGQRPMQVVTQRAKRDILVSLITPDSPWRADPKLLEAVNEAISLYHSCRAPLYPLPALQRLGYLDEEDFIECRVDLPGFDAGQRYAVSTQSVTVKRSGSRPNLQGDPEEIEFSGNELAILLTNKDGIQRCFMEARLRAPSITISPPGKVEFTLQDLVEHFVIPDVADISQVNREAFTANMEAINKLEGLLA